MKFSFEYKVDRPNKLLICESYGDVTKSADLEHMLKTIIKMAGKNQIKRVVLDATELTISYSLIEVSNIMQNMKEQDWLGDIKIARIVKPEQNTQNVIGDMAERLSLPIKNFETRSDAMLWLLFDKVSKR